jgi:hypothetical protein
MLATSLLLSREQRAGVLPSHARGGVGILSQRATVAAWRDGVSWLSEVRGKAEPGERSISFGATAHMRLVCFCLPSAMDTIQRQTERFLKERVKVFRLHRRQISLPREAQQKVAVLREPLTDEIVHREARKVCRSEG